MGSYDQHVREGYLISISGVEKETKKEMAFDGEGIRGRKVKSGGTLMGRDWDPSTPPSHPPPLVL